MVRNRYRNLMSWDHFRFTGNKLRLLYGCIITIEPASIIVLSSWMKTIIHLYHTGINVSRILDMKLHFFGDIL